MVYTVVFLHALVEIERVPNVVLRKVNTRNIIQHEATYLAHYCTINLEVVSVHL